MIVAAERSVVSDGRWSAVEAALEELADKKQQVLACLVPQIDAAMDALWAVIGADARLTADALADGYTE